MIDHVTKAYSGVYTGEVRDNGTVLYKGIQYAAAARWQRPSVVPKSDRHFDATAYGPASDAGDPDCLNLTLCVCPEPPELTSAAESTNAAESSKAAESTNAAESNEEADAIRPVKMKKAVYVWQYGSAQFGGTNSCINFENFVAEHPDIIVVCPNHRGQFFGTIDLSMLEGYAEQESVYNASNNLARLDLLACLQWVRENIAYFGGDPGNVTIGGHSSGSNNMTCLMMMEEARPYFNKAICQASFCCDTSLQPLETARMVSAELFRRMGISTLKEALEASTENINNSMREMFGSVIRGEGPFDHMEYKFFSPVMDNVVLMEDGFAQMANGGLKDKKLIFGHNSGEYDKQFDRWKDSGEDGAKAALSFTISQNFEKLSPEGRNGAQAAQVIADYFSRNEEYDRDDFTAAMDLKNDLMLRCDAVMFALAASKCAETYLYFNDWEAAPAEGQRVGHGAENGVIAGSCRIPAGREAGARLIRDLWSSFIVNGTPESAELPCVWQPFDADTQATLFISEEPHMVPGVRGKDLELLMPLLREYPIVR